MLPFRDDFETMDLIEAKENGKNRHPWEISRARCILSLLKISPKTPILDIGSGDMYFTRLLAEKYRGVVIALDINYKTSSREGNILIRRDINEIAPDSLALITMMDVLEHVEDELSFLHAAVGKLQSGGTVLLTVPAHMYLFSEHDVFLRHIRRYDKKGLDSVLSSAGLKVELVSYFYLIPYCVRLFQVTLKRLGFRGSTATGVGGWNYPLGHQFTRFLAVLLDVDFYVGRFFYKFGLNLPGLSIVSICTKKSA